MKTEYEIPILVVNEANAEDIICLSNDEFGDEDGGF